jgi:hypothetical protein
MNNIEIILDCLADDCESIVQTENWFDYLGINIERIEIITLIRRMIIDEIIEVADSSILSEDDCINIAEIEGYWFRMTQKGRDIWEAIQGDY